MVLQRQGQGSAAAAPDAPGHGNRISPFRCTAAPVQLKGLKTLPPSCRLPFSRPNNLISFHYSSSVMLPRPRSLSFPPGPSPSHSHPPWEAGPGAGAVPERCPCPSPSVAHHPPCRQGTQAACPGPQALLPSRSMTANTHPR